MAEREVVVDKMRLTYEGLFDVTELYKLIDRFMKEKGVGKGMTIDYLNKKMVEVVVNYPTTSEVEEKNYENLKPILIKILEKHPNYIFRRQIY